MLIYMGKYKERWNMDLYYTAVRQGDLLNDQFYIVHNGMLPPWVKETTSFNDFKHNKLLNGWHWIYSSSVGNVRLYYRLS